MDNQAANKRDELCTSLLGVPPAAARCATFLDRYYSCMSKCSASATVWLPTHKINTKLSATNFRQLQC